MLRTRIDYKPHLSPIHDAEKRIRVDDTLDARYNSSDRSFRS